MSPAARRFLDRLRFALSEVTPVDLGLLHEKTVLARTDMLFEKAADFSDAVDHWERGLVNETTLREAAVAVACEAVKVYLASIRGGVEHGR